MVNLVPSFPELFIDLNSFTEGSMIEICKRIVPGWVDLDDKKFRVSKISGGITNSLFKVSYQPESEKVERFKDVAVRVFGPNTEFVINRESERLILQHLSNAGFGAKLFGFFSNGFVQMFINARTLEPKDMCDPKFVKLIAKEIRKFHESDISLDSGHVEPNEAMLWETLHKFLSLAKTVHFSDNTEKQALLDKIDLSKIESEVEELRRISEDVHSPVVFSHNDLLSGNFMFNEADEKIHVIDFEYSSYSYRGFDIGNHFNEYAGFDCDFSLYPTKDQQYLFFRSYLNPENPDECNENDLQRLYIESNFFALASHLFWALWAIIQAKYSPIDFDYLSYFFLRYDEFLKQKDETIAMVLGQQSN